MYRVKCNLKLIFNKKQELRLKFFLEFETDLLTFIIKSNKIHLVERYFFQQDYKFG